MTKSQKIYKAGMKAAEKHPKSHIAINTDSLELVAYGLNFTKVYHDAIKKVPSGNVFFCGKGFAYACTATK